MENIKFEFFQEMINRLSLRVLDHGYLYADSNWNFQDITSPFSRLYLITAGEGYIENSDQRVLLQPGKAYLIPSYATYHYSCPNMMEKFYIHFRLEFLPGQDIFEGWPECPWQPIREGWVQDFIKKASSSRVDEMILCKSFLMELIGAFSAPLMKGDRFTYFMKNALKYRALYEYIENHCYADITIGRIADHMRISPSTLSKNFKQDTGDTVKGYIQKKVIQKAKDKLLLSQLSVKEIAYQLRFSDPFYFSRFFKRHTGMSPMEYRKQNTM